MPETYGLPEEEPTTAEQALDVAAQVIAGQGIVRRVVLYGLLATALVSPLAPLGVVPLILLIATDRNLS